MTSNLELDFSFEKFYQQPNEYLNSFIRLCRNIAPLCKDIKINLIFTTFGRSTLYFTDKNDFYNFLNEWPQILSNCSRQ